MAGPLLFCAFVGLVVVAIVYNNIYEKKQTETLRAIAAQLGLDFAAIDATGLQAGFAGFNLFEHGRSKTIRNIAYGRIDDAEVMMFEYSYTTGSGKNRHTRTQTVGFFQSDRLAMPEFVARPEGLFDKIGQVFGYQDIDLPSHPEFSKRYILRGVDEGAIRSFFDSGVARHFENNRTISIETKLDRFIIYQPARRLKPEQWRDGLSKGRETLAVLLNGRN
jgi:hypothetical protein